MPTRKINVKYRNAPPLVWVLNEDGEWECPHRYTRYVKGYGGHYSGGRYDDPDWQDDDAIVCDQCGAYQWTEGDDQGWHEDDECPTYALRTLGGGVEG